MTKKVIVCIDFNIAQPWWTNNPFDQKRLTKEWIERRLDIFMNYTYKSLKTQTNQNFLTLMKCDVLSKDIIEEVLSKYEQLQDNVKLVYENTLSVIENEIKNVDYMYMLILDSDNIIHPTLIEQISDYEIEDNEIYTKGILCKRGYMYHIPTNTIAHMDYEIGLDTFLTWIYKSEDYINGKFHKLEGDFVTGLNKLPHHVFENKNYIITVHDLNVMNRKRTRDLITDSETRDEILREFKIIE